MTHLYLDAFLMLFCLSGLVYPATAASSIRFCSSLGSWDTWCTDRVESKNLRAKLKTKFLHNLFVLRIRVQNQSQLLPYQIPVQYQQSRLMVSLLDFRR